VEGQVVDSRQEQNVFRSPEKEKDQTLSGGRTAFYSMGTEIPSMG